MKSFKEFLKESELKNLININEFKDEISVSSSNEMINVSFYKTPKGEFFDYIDYYRKYPNELEKFNEDVNSRIYKIQNTCKMLQEATIENYISELLNFMKTHPLRK